MKPIRVLPMLSFPSLNSFRLSRKSLKGAQCPSAIPYGSLGSRRRRGILTKEVRAFSAAHSMSPRRRTAPSRLDRNVACRPVVGLWLPTAAPAALRVALASSPPWVPISESDCLTPPPCRPPTGSLTWLPRSGPAPPLPARGRVWASPLSLAPAACPPHVPNRRGSE